MAYFFEETDTAKQIKDSNPILYEILTNKDFLWYELYTDKYSIYQKIKPVTYNDKLVFKINLNDKEYCIDYKEFKHWMDQYSKETCRELKIKF